MSKPILCLDFDGVIHGYQSGWRGADCVPDPPIPGAMRFVWDATEHFRVAVFSSRSNQRGGISAMRSYLTRHFREHWAADRTTCDDKLSDIEWPTEKPAAFLTIDDRALTFDGTWPDVRNLLNFKPWNKREKLGVTGQFPEGKLSRSNEGEIRMAIRWDEINKVVRVDFGTSITWFGLSQEEAVAMARLLLRHAGREEQ
jgi:hypothetical protein